MIKTKIPMNKNRQDFLVDFAYFCLDKYKQLLKENLFSNYTSKCFGNKKYFIKKEDGTLIDFEDFIDKLKIKLLPKENSFIIYYFDPKEKADLFKQLYFSKKLESQAAGFQKATHIYNNSYQKILGLYYIKLFKSPSNK